MGFDHRTASREEIVGRARGLEGITLGEIPGARFKASTGGTGRHEAGLAVEAFFGIPPNSRAEADFPGAGVELKVLPLVRAGRELRIKERTVLSMIDYEALLHEKWANAKIRSKLDILFVFFEHLPNKPKAQFPIRGTVMWSPTGAVERFIRADWEHIHRKVTAGHAHLLSEADGRLMGPCTKSSDSTRRRRQPRSAELAKPRAWALKPAYTRTIYLASKGQLDEAESLLKNLAVSDAKQFERRVIDQFRPYVGHRVAEVGDGLAVPRSRAKAYAGTVARIALGAQSVRRKIEEFEWMGLMPRTVRCTPERKPYEATPFRIFRYRELLDEDWANSDLLAQIEYMLFIPIVGETRKTPAAMCTFGTPVFWRPTAEALDLIRGEWDMYRDLIRAGKADRLPGASETRAIHVRTHGRDSADTDDAPRLGPIPKKSFWLNPRFVQGILLGEN